MLKLLKMNVAYRYSFRLLKHYFGCKTWHAPNISLLMSECTFLVILRYFWLIVEEILPTRETGINGVEWPTSIELEQML